MSEAVEIQEKAVVDFSEGWDATSGAGKEATKEEEKAPIKEEELSAKEPETEKPDKPIEAKAPVKGDGKDDQRQRSLDGIVRSERAKRTEAEKRVTQMETELNELRNKKAEPEVVVDQEDIVARLLKDPKIQALEKDGGQDFTSALAAAVRMASEESDRKFGNLSKSTEDRIAAITKELKGQMQEFQPAIEHQKTQAQEKHFGLVSEAHPDYKTFLDTEDENGVVEGELTKWMAGHPDEDYIRQVAAGGSTSQVVAMLTRFKSETGVGVFDKHEEKQNKKKALADMAGATTTKRPVSVTTADKKGGSFEDGWAN